MGYKILEHPSDLGIEATGSSPAEAYCFAAEGLMSVILDTHSADKKQAREIIITAEDREQLLVKWLSEILYLYDGEHFVPKDFEIHHLTDTSLRATMHGEAFDEEKHKTLLDVKAITYHQLSIDEQKDKTTVRVFLDI